MALDRIYGPFTLLIRTIKQHGLWRLFHGHLVLEVVGVVW